MARHPHRQRAEPQDIAAEIIRRASRSNGDDCRSTAYVIRLANPPSVQERFELMAARLQRRPIVIMAHSCAGLDEWLQRYGPMKGS